MLGRCLRKAWSDTFALLGGWASALAILVIAPVGFFFHWLMSGALDVMGEVEVWLVYGLAATGTVFGALFLFNLACAPYQLEKERHQETRRKLTNAELRAKSQEQGRRLNAEDKQRISTLIRQYPFAMDGLGVVHFTASSECADFAAELGEAIRLAGAKATVMADAIFFQRDPKLTGLLIVTSDNHDFVQFSDRFRMLLEDAGHQVRLQIEDGPVKPFIYVARIDRFHLEPHIS